MLRGSRASNGPSSASKHGAALVAVLILVSGGAFAGARMLTSQQRAALGGRAQVNLAGALPTVARPLPAFAKQMTLADAQTALGQSVVMPLSAEVAPSDAGPVWVASLTDQLTGVTTTTVAVTFPSQGMVVEYTRPAPSDGSAAHFRAMATGMVSPGGAPIAQVISLGGSIPALAVQQNSDDTGANFGEIVFNVGGSEVRVMGHTDQAELQGVAESILERSGS